MITLNKDDDSNVESCCVTSDARHPRVCLRKTRNGPFVSWLWPFWSVFGLSDTLYNLTICDEDVICIQSSNCQHGLQESLQKVSDFIVRGKLANHLADVHQLDHIQRRQYLQEAKLQPKVKVVVYESEADNSGKNHSTSTRNPVQTQEKVYELSRSRRNEASFKAKAKTTTTNNKTNRKKQRKSDSCFRGHRGIV